MLSTSDRLDRAKKIKKNVVGALAYEGKQLPREQTKRCTKGGYGQLRVLQWGKKNRLPGSQQGQQVKRKKRCSVHAADDCALFWGWHRDDCLQQQTGAREVREGDKKGYDRKAVKKGDHGCYLTLILDCDEAGTHLSGPLVLPYFFLFFFIGHWSL